MTDTRKKWTPDLLAERFKESMLTMSRMPEVQLNKLFTTKWPAIKRSLGELLAQEQRPMHIYPTSEDISRLEETYLWIIRIKDPIKRKLIWYHASGMSGSAIKAKLKVSWHRTTIRRKWRSVLASLSFYLNSIGVRVEPLTNGY